MNAVITRVTMRITTKKTEIPRFQASNYNAKEGKGAVDEANFSSDKLVRVVEQLTSTLTKFATAGDDLFIVSA